MSLLCSKFGLEATNSRLFKEPCSAKTCQQKPVCTTVGRSRSSKHTPKLKTASNLSWSRSWLWFAQAASKTYSSHYGTVRIASTSYMHMKHVLTWICTCLRTYIHTHTHIHDYIHTYIHTHLHTYIRTYIIRTYLHTCIHDNINMCKHTCLCMHTKASCLLLYTTVFKN